MAQLVNTAAMPFIFKHVAAMPDVHWGIGAKDDKKARRLGGPSVCTEFERLGRLLDFEAEARLDHLDLADARDA